MKLLFVFVLFVLLLQVLFGSALVNQPDNSLANVRTSSIEVDKKDYHHRKRINCGYACTRRCSDSSRKNVCLRACKSCCNRCQCVPPGTYGNTHVCPCYAALRTHGNRPKCP